MKNYKVCVIGAGKWGKNHIHTLYQLNALGGVVDQKKQAIDHIKSLYPNCKLHFDLDEALNNNYDGFIVSTPPITHFEIAKRIIDLNKPVLVEKPLTLNLKDAIALNNLAKQI